MNDAVNHIVRQIAWSSATFGRTERTVGISEHIRKELVEIEQAPDAFSRAEEWVDVVILGIDGLWRALRAAMPFASNDMIANQMMSHIVNKQNKNEMRDWPPRDQQSEDKATEHVRS